MSVVSIEIVANDVDDVRKRLGNTGHIRRAEDDLLDQTARIGEHSAVMYAPERTRRLRKAIGSTPARRATDGAREATVGVGRVSALAGGRFGPMPEGEDEYPLYVHEGTGLFGYYARLIRPRRARAMRWFGRTGLVFARTTRGQRARPYIREAFDDINEYLPAAIERMVDRILRGRL